jgi:hypothetical protein
MKAYFLEKFHASKEVFALKELLLSVLVTDEVEIKVN